MKEGRAALIILFLLTTVLSYQGLLRSGVTVGCPSGFGLQRGTADVGYAVVLDITVNGSTYEYRSNSSTELIRHYAPSLLENQSVAAMAGRTDGMVASYAGGNLPYAGGNPPYELHIAAFNQTTYVNLFVEFVARRLDNGTVQVDDLQSSITVYDDDDLECSHIDILVATLAAAHNHSLELIDRHTFEPQPGYPVLLLPGKRSLSRAWEGIRMRIAGGCCHYEAPSLRVDTAEVPLWVVTATYNMSGSEIDEILAAKYNRSYTGGTDWWCPWPVTFVFTLNGTLLMVDSPPVTACMTTGNSTITNTTVGPLVGVSGTAMAAVVVAVVLARSKRGHR